MNNSQKRNVLIQLLQGNTGPARALRFLTLDLDQFTIDELDQLRIYQEARQDDLVSIPELETVFSRPLRLIQTTNPKL
ncbi:hypothetical protein [Larkinella punicea]|uniref:Uncharacterized protein n=1 Tax=Larkinella punicea TaxID=2315727 RepID=A0A368JNT4_9BACT|nr:hypothetical protein [Larkinella punicea]RCR68314.1 hypothetical protein DUE52_18130 [Larkinella punicea]